MKTPGSLRRSERKRTRNRLWTRRERAVLFARLRRFSVWSAYVAALILPGGIALLPVLAWWHRHRHPERAIDADLGRRLRRRLAVPGAPAADAGDPLKSPTATLPSGLKQ